MCFLCIPSIDTKNFCLFCAMCKFLLLIYILLRGNMMAKSNSARKVTQPSLKQPLTEIMVRNQVSKEAAAMEKCCFLT